MQAKYRKYWKEIPLLYAFAFILDPRAKIEAFGTVLSLLTDVVGRDYCAYFSDVKAKFCQLFDKYNEKYAGVRQHRTTSQPTAGKKKTACGKIFSSSSGSSSSTAGTHLGGGDRELDTYLRSPIVSFEESNEDEFNILKWWQDHKMTYPVLSILAQDVFTVPVSTTSSESAFSLAGRIFEERRACLTPDMVSTLMTVKDMVLAKHRAQHTPMNPELTAAFQNIYLDEAEQE